MHVLTANPAFADLLGVLGLTTDAFLRGPLAGAPEGDGAADAYYAALAPGQCIVRRLAVGPQQHYTFHLVKLALPIGCCLCCMLMPDQDPSHARFSGLLNDIACFVAEIDAKGNISYLNDRLLNHLGYPSGDRNQPDHLSDLMVTYYADNLQRWLREIKSEGVIRFRKEFTDRRGAGHLMEISLVASSEPNQSLFLLTARDLTIQLEHESTLTDTLRQAEQTAGDLRTQNAQLRARLDRRLADTGLVYGSEPFSGVIERIQHVAPTPAPVLITGETGTGKELIARTIHRLSSRADHPFVVVDCANLPPARIESSLFGYRKGAFTGAVSDQIGRFAAADKGTLFFDEIGELPLPLQTRLLRVLKDGQYTSLGGNAYRALDVRVVASTHRDMEKWVEQGKFRSDLYYRLNVFPVVVPPLRERMDDLQPLIAHFVKRFNRKYAKRITGIDATTLARVAEYNFPGNVRELENMVEHAFIVSSGKLLPLAVPSPQAEPVSDAIKPVLDVFDGTLTEFLSFDEYQRKYIQLVLDSTAGKVSGPGGAAEILKIHPQTLFSKLRKLGIRR